MSADKMDDILKAYENIKRKEAEKAVRTKNCLDDNALCAYVDGKLSGSELRGVVKHLADCAYCRRESRELMEALAFSPSKEEIARSADIVRKIQKKIAADMPQKRWNIDFLKNAVKEISEPFVFAPATAVGIGFVPSPFPFLSAVMRGSQKEYKGAKISRVWKIDSADLRITVEKKKNGKIHFLIRVLKSKKPLANETVKLGRESKVTNRQGLAEFTVQASSRRSSITLSVPGLDQKVRIGIKSIK